MLVECLETYHFDHIIIDAAKKLEHDRSDSIYDHLEVLRTMRPAERFEASIKSVPFLLDHYERLGIEHAIISETILDLNYRIMKFYDQHHYLGITENDIKWLNLLFKAEIFKIGSLRFQKFPLDYKEIERSGEDAMPLSQDIKAVFVEGMPMINVHIQTGTDLSDHSVENSFNRAQTFFEKTFPHFQARYFICRTWLLHPSVRQVLDSDSNIIKFKNRFELIATSNNYTQALERIYGTENLDEIKHMKKTSSLAKKAYLIYQDLGVGCAVIEIKRS